MKAPGIGLLHLISPQAGEEPDHRHRHLLHPRDERPPDSRRTTEKRVELALFS
jgi:hypothetical protein